MKPILTILFAGLTCGCSIFNNVDEYQEVIYEYKGFSNLKNITFIGRVVDIENQDDCPIMLTKVKLFGDNYKDSTSTDIDGNFKFVNINPGSYKVTINSLGYNYFKSDTLYFKEGELKVILFKLKANYINRPEIFIDH